MLEKQHNGVDGRDPKCWFSSTMKRNMNWTGPRARGGVLGLASALAAMWLSGCATQDGAYHGAPAESAAPATSPARISRSAPDAAKARAEAAPRQKAAEERPGLATGFGEQTKSPWNRQSFVRATSSKPAGTAVCYYNDKEGIDAMSGYRRKVDPVRMAAGEMLEWGIKGGFGYLPTYTESSFGGSRRTFVVGSRDSNYSIVLKNRCKSRLEVVLSVDGLDVIDGKSASFSKRGYVLAPEETLEVKGWRTSPDTVARFKFSTVRGSYANLAHGDHRNVGVIGMAVFTEKGVDPWTWMPREVNDRLEADPFAKAP
jgi:hypothetical protein